MIEEKNVLGLATIRRNRGISLEQIAESTKISIRSLAAIEQGDFRKLPGGIYNTSYIRQYARAIEYDECALIAFYKREMERAEGTARNGTNGNGGYGGMRPASSVMGD
jgi:cytoskeletal protein RodZ